MLKPLDIEELFVRLLATVRIGAVSSNSSSTFISSSLLNLCMLSEPKPSSARPAASAVDVFSPKQEKLVGNFPTDSGSLMDLQEPSVFPPESEYKVLLLVILDV